MASEASGTVMIAFSQRPASLQWEACPLLQTAGPMAWIWFKPPQAPQSVAIRLGPELWQAAEVVPRLTVRTFAAISGINQLQGWTLYGHYVALDPSTEPLLDTLLPTPMMGVDPLLVLWPQRSITEPPVREVGTPPALVPPMMMAPYTASLPVAYGTGAGAATPEERAMLEQIAEYWRVILQLDTEIRRVRMQLEQSVSKVSSLNRELNNEEALAADNADKKDWQDVRRWLRDCAAGLSRSIKEIDIGVMSGAGQRHRFEDMMKQFVEPRIPFAGLPQAVTDFEMFHKSAKNVISAAQSALNKGTADGERRANLVLQRIAGKVRQKRSKARGG